MLPLWELPHSSSAHTARLKCSGFQIPLLKWSYICVHFDLPPTQTPIFTNTGITLVALFSLLCKSRRIVPMAMWLEQSQRQSMQNNSFSFFFFNCCDIIVYYIILHWAHTQKYFIHKAGSSSCEPRLRAAERDKDEIQEAAVSLAAAKGISLNSAVAVWHFHIKRTALWCCASPSERQRPSPL